MAKSLVSELYPYTALLAKLSKVLLSANKLRKSHPQFLAGAIMSYVNVCRAVIEKGSYLWKSATKGRVRSNPGRRTLEELERLFMEFRDAAEMTEYTAQRLEHSGNSKEARKARKMANALAYHTQAAAKGLVALANELEIWTQEWEQRVGIRPWLR